MKIFIVFFALLYTLMAANAESAAFLLDYKEEYKTALAEAKQENKKLLVVVVQDPCPYCDKLVHNTLADPEVKKALKDYVGVILDKKGIMPKQFRTSMTPMTYFVNPKTETVAWESLGYAKKGRFLADLKEANKELK